MGVSMVRDAVVRPQRCAFLPVIASDRAGFFDFGTELAGEHVYLSVTAFRECAEKVGYVPGSSLVPLQARVARLVEQVEAKDARIAALEAQIGAVEVLRAGGFSAGRKPGRPKKAPEQAVA